MTLPIEEYIEQAHFFRTLRKRLGEDLPAQEILEQIHEEILSTTQLPLAIQFLTSELKLHGVMSPAMDRLPHYFTPWQAYVISRAEDNRVRFFDFSIALLILEREAEYKSKQTTQPGLFVFQFEAISRNRLGYDEGLKRVAQDPVYDDQWRQWIRQLTRKISNIDFGDWLYLNSEFHLIQRRRVTEGAVSSKWPILFGEKEGKIAWANRGKDPLFLFSALQRQLNYPVVPKLEYSPQVNLIPTLERKIHQLEMRVKLLESELKGSFDLSQFYVQPGVSGGSEKGISP